MKLRFSIRDLLWLTLVVALCVAWRISYSKLVKNHQAQVDAVMEYCTDQDEKNRRAISEISERVSATFDRMREDYRRNGIPFPSDLYPK